MVGGQAPRGLVEAGPATGVDGAASGGGGTVVGGTRVGNGAGLLSCWATCGGCRRKRWEYASAGLLGDSRGGMAFRWGWWVPGVVWAVPVAVSAGSWAAELTEASAAWRSEPRGGSVVVVAVDEEESGRRGLAADTADDDAEVDIRDAKLRAVIESALGKESGAAVTVAEMRSLTSLAAWTAGISDLTGLEHATGLERLVLTNNEISDLGPLAGLASLTWLDLALNQVVDVRPLAELTALEYLNLWNNRISEIGPLSGLARLRHLQLQRNEIADIGALAGLVSLTWLELSSNGISDVSPLAGLTSLTYLRLRRNEIADVSALSGLTALTSVDLMANEVVDVSPLAQLDALVGLGLCWNKVQDVSDLSGMTTLRTLLVCGNEVADVTPLGELAGLTRLTLFDNRIVDVGPLAALTGLEQLELGDNRIADVSPLAGLESLSALFLWNNEIADIGPLVDNAGIGADDLVQVWRNPLDERSRDEHLAALEGRGVRLVHAPRDVPFVPAAADEERQGFVRIVNREEGAFLRPVWIHAVDDAGASRPAARIGLVLGRNAHFNSDDLEFGNLAKELYPEYAVGAGEGGWRLELYPEYEVDVSAYMRTSDGFLTAMNALAPATADGYRVATFNPGSNEQQVSSLRLANPGYGTVEVAIRGVDDAGASSTGSVRLTLAPGQARTLTAQALESGAGLEGALGDRDGKWRLDISTDGRIQAMSLLESPTGHLTNLSGVPDNAEALSDGRTLHRIPLFPAADDAHARQGFARVVNHGVLPASVRIDAIDDAGARHGPATLTVPAGATAHFNSDDLEAGNPGKGFVPGVGNGTGAWRIELTTAANIDVLSYIRTGAGFLAAMHDTVSGVEDDEGMHAYELTIFNPGGNRNQVSQLRAVNDGDAPTELTITGIDDAGRATTDDMAVRLTLRAGEARTLTAQELESGEGLDGALGDGDGKWRLIVRSERPVVLMNLLASPTGHLTNLSGAGRVDDIAATSSDIYRTSIAMPVVQANCVGCHVAGGTAGDTRLVFVLDTVADYEVRNLEAFADYLRVTGGTGDVVLAKALGMADHGGGAQLAADGEDYANLARFLPLLRIELDEVLEVREDVVELVLSEPGVVAPFAPDVLGRFLPAVRYTGGGRLAFSLAGGPLGATVDADTGQFSWTPGAGDAGGTFAVSIEATDGDLAGVLDLSVVVLSPSSVAVERVPGRLTVVDAGTSLEGLVVADDGDPPQGNAGVAGVVIEKVDRDAVAATLPEGLAAVSDFFAVRETVVSPVELTFPVRDLMGADIRDVSLYTLATPVSRDEPVWIPVVADWRYEGVDGVLAYVVSVGGLGGLYVFGLESPAVDAEPMDARTGRTMGRATEYGGLSTAASPTELLSRAGIGQFVGSGEVDSNEIRCEAGVVWWESALLPNFRSHACTYGLDEAVEIRVKDFGEVQWGRVSVEELARWVIAIQQRLEDLGLAHEKTITVDIDRSWWLFPGRDANTYGEYLCLPGSRNTITLSGADRWTPVHVLHGLAHEYFHHVQCHEGDLAVGSGGEELVRVVRPYLHWGRGPLFGGEEARARANWLIEGSADWFASVIQPESNPDWVPVDTLANGLNAVDREGSQWAYDRQAFFALAAEHCSAFPAALRRMLSIDPDNDPSGIRRLQAVLPGTAGCTYGYPANFASGTDGLEAALWRYSVVARPNALRSLGGVAFGFFGDFPIGLVVRGGGVAYSAESRLPPSSVVNRRITVRDPGTDEGRNVQLAAEPSTGDVLITIFDTDGEGVQVLGRAASTSMNGQGLSLWRDGAASSYRVNAPGPDKSLVLEYALVNASIDQEAVVRESVRVSPPSPTEVMKVADAESGIELAWEGEGAEYVVEVHGPDGGPPVRHEVSTKSLVVEDLADPGAHCFAVVAVSADGVESQPSAKFCPEAACTGEREILEAFYEATGGDNWTNNEGWLLAEDLGDWSGIEVRDGCVTRVDLYDNGLTGSIPPELGELASLHSLLLHGNDLSGSIPRELGKLGNLVNLALSANDLTGSIPRELGNLIYLRSLYIENTMLSGSIPPTLGKLAYLSNLVLNGNKLDGSIPRELGGLGNLYALGLAENSLSGSIPPELAALGNLSYLHLCCNELTGSIPSELGDMSKLVAIDLKGNKLSGSIPEELGKLPNLLSLHLQRNRFSGSIPIELGELGLTFLSLTGNELTGSIPPELGKLDDLNHLGLADNRLTGSIPSELGNLRELLYLELWGNSLSGEIPLEVVSLPNLVSMSLARNMLGGTIPPELGERSNLAWLWLSENELTGPIPRELGNLVKLKTLLLDDNNLSGSVPSELGRLGRLERLQIKSNRLVGELPGAMVQMRALSQLYFSHNHGLCAPRDARFQQWLSGLDGWSGPLCEEDDEDD